MHLANCNLLSFCSLCLNGKKITAFARLNFAHSFMLTDQDFIDKFSPKF